MQTLDPPVFSYEPSTPYSVLRTQKFPLVSCMVAAEATVVPELLLAQTDLGSCFHGSKTTSTLVEFSIQLAYDTTT